MYPMALILFHSLSGLDSSAWFPQDFPLLGWLPVPNPIKELHVWQSFSLLLTIPILTLERLLQVLKALNPSMLQFFCNEASLPINFFHSSRPSEVLRYRSSAISECRESACLLMTMNLNCSPIFIPRHILEKEVFQ